MTERSAVAERSLEATVDQTTEPEVPSAFLRAFEPTLAERAAAAGLRLRQLIGRVVDRHSDRLWQSRPNTAQLELEHVWLGEYGLVPPTFERSTSRLDHYR